MCRLFETIRVENGKAVALRWHQQRVEQITSVELAPYIERLSLPADGVYKLRIDYDTASGIIGSTLQKYEERRGKTQKAVPFDNI